MRISEQKKMELYRAIHENITDLRIKLVTSKITSPVEIDVQLAQLEHPIWRDIKKALNITE